MTCHWGCGTTETKRITNRRELESSGTEGNTPVGESENGGSGIPSTAGHEEPRGKQEGPPSKAKYDPVTDSA